MSIVEALKMSDGDLRISSGDRWMCWNVIDNQWEVREHKPYQRETTVLIATKEESAAVVKLLETE